MNDHSFSERRLLYFANPEALGSNSDSADDAPEMPIDHWQKVREALYMRPRAETRDKREAASRTADRERLTDLESQIASSSPLDDPNYLAQSFFFAHVMDYLRGGAIPLQVVEALNQANIEATVDDMHALQQTLRHIHLTDRDFTLLDKKVRGRMLTAQEQIDSQQLADRIRAHCTDKETTILDHLPGNRSLFTGLRFQ